MRKQIEEDRIVQKEKTSKSVHLLDQQPDKIASVSKNNQNSFTVSSGHKAQLQV